MEQNLMASVGRFCDWQFAANEPAMWETFHRKYPQFKRSDFANGTSSWRGFHQSDTERMRWYVEVRIKRINVAECVNRYLDWRFAAGQSATWEDLHKIFPAAKQGNFKKIISLWRITHKMDSSALWWFNRIRPGKINAAQYIARYLDWHYAENTPAPWADFSRICDQASKNAYNHGIYSWRDQNKSDLEAMKWFETVLSGKVRGREQVRRYINWKYAAGDFAKWVDFHKKCPQVAKRVFKDGRREWRKIYQHDTQAMEWYQQTVIDKYNGTERVRLYLYWRYAASSIASWDDFHKLCPKVAKNTYNVGKSSWKKNNCENPDITEWLKLGIEKHRNEKNWIVRYFDWQCAADEPANWTDCGKKCSDITKKIFHKAKEEWYRSHLTNPDAIQWYQNTRLTPSLNSRIIKWIDQRYELNESCWYYYFHKQYPDIKYSVFKRGRENWRYIHREDRKFREWIDPFLISKKSASLAGHLFEQYIIAHLQPALREREIVFYYNTTSFVESAKFKGHYDKSAKRVEGRLLISDLIAQNTKIGASLRNFLLSCGRSQLALDITIGHDIGSKIKRYADEITALLVVTPYGVSGQRLIESHIRIISISEFTGPHWLNLDNSTRIAIENTINECFDAIRGGPVSPEWQRFQANAIYKWASVVDAIKAYGSQSEYRMRVVEGVTMALKRGTIPTELEAYAETARAAGHTVYADLMEGLAQTITALARQSIDQRKPMHEPIPKMEEIGANTKIRYRWSRSICGISRAWTARTPSRWNRILRQTKGSIKRTPRIMSRVKR